MSFALMRPARAEDDGEAPAPYLWTGLVTRPGLRPGDDFCLEVGMDFVLLSVQFLARWCPLSARWWIPLGRSPK